MEHLCSPLVTIGLSVYNGSKYINDTLASIANQTYNNLEIYIVDDNSSDNSFNLCKQWSSTSRFKVYTTNNNSNKGLTSNCNLILNQAKGKYLHLFDQDDIMLPGKIAHDVALFENLDEEVALLYSKMKLIDDNGIITNQEYNERIGFDGILREDPFEQLIKKNFIPAPTVMLRTDLIKKTGGYDESILFNDWDMWLKVARNFKIHFIDATNVYYRIHPKSMMGIKGIEKEMERNSATFKMLINHLGFRKKYDQIIFNKLRELAIYSYVLGDAKAKDYLQFYLKHRFDTKVWLYHKMLIAGIKHPSHFIKSANT